MGERRRRRHRAPPLLAITLVATLLFAAARTGAAPLRSALSAAGSAAASVVAPARSMAAAIQAAGTAATSTELQEAEVVEDQAYLENGSFVSSPLRGVTATIYAGGAAVVLTSSMGGSCAGLLLIPTRLPSPIDGTFGPATRTLRGASAGCG